MEGNKDSDLVTAILMYAIRCLAEGDHTALRNMNFGPHEIEALREMNLSDLYRVESLRVHCLKIELDRQVYWPMMAHLRQQSESEETQQTLIAADAPLEMMQTLFGVGPREYSRMRRMLSVSPSVGRPPEPDEAGTHTLWHAWVDRVGDDQSELLSPPAYLELQAETGLSMRAIWNLIKRWDQYGDLTGRCESDSAGRPGINE